MGRPDGWAGVEASMGTGLPEDFKAFTELYGLVVRDTQIRVLLGEPVPDPEALQNQERVGREKSADHGLDPSERRKARSRRARRGPACLHSVRKQ